jgi:hypothetical protein
MATYNVKVTVDYEFEFEADSREEAEAEGWKYEDYAHHASVDCIDIDRIDEGEEDDE